MTRQPASRPPADAGPPRIIKELVVRELAANELGAAANLLAAAMRDNPLHVKVFGVDAERRHRRLQRLLGQLAIHVHANGVLLGACAHGELVGVLGVLKPGRCRPAPRQLLRMAGAIIIGNPPLGILRIQRWLSTWKHRDPREAHTHLGPLAVSATWRRQGVARRLMEQCCEQLDALEEVAWLETDLALNVAFYETLGFVVALEQTVLGVPNWFMRRVPGQSGFA